MLLPLLPIVSVLLSHNFRSLLDWTNNKCNSYQHRARVGKERRGTSLSSDQSSSPGAGSFLSLFCTVSSPPVPGTPAGNAGMGLEVMLQRTKPRFSCSLPGQARPGASHSPGLPPPPWVFLCLPALQNVLLHVLACAQLCLGLAKGGHWQQSLGSAGRDSAGTEVGDI